MEPVDGMLTLALAGDGPVVALSGETLATSLTRSSAATARRPIDSRRPQWDVTWELA